MSNLDNYIENVIKVGDKGSALLNSFCAPTLKHCKYVDVISQGMNGIAVLKNLPNDMDVIVYSMGGDPLPSDFHIYNQSAVEDLVKIARQYGITPLAFADVVDASKGHEDDIKAIGKDLYAVAKYHQLAIMNGELAILGDRVDGIANINATMIGLVPKGKFPKEPFVLEGYSRKSRAAVFSHEGKPVYINSDGIGTKTEFYERIFYERIYARMLKGIERCLDDSLGMKLDDTMKLGATAKVVSDIIDWTSPSHQMDFDLFFEYAKQRSKDLGVQYIIDFEHGDGRIKGYSKNAPALNVSGSVVSIIDEDRLKNPPAPQEGDSLISICGKPNPRSNGITDKRKIMVKLFGNDYQDTPEGKMFLEYLAEPSIVFYPHFKHMLDNGWATSFYHMSGGAYNGKLAKPLAKHGLFADIDRLSSPDWRELALGGASFTPVREAYSKWPMGNDAFVTVPKEHIGNVVSYIVGHDMHYCISATLKKYPKKTGVRLEAFNGKKIYFPGKEVQRKKVERSK